jgi:hypothetical protein
MSRTSFRQRDIERAVKAAKAIGLKVSVVEGVTTDGTTIRICSQRDEPGERNEWDLVLHDKN